MIISGPGIAPAKTNAPARVTEIAPTLIDWIKPPAPATESKAMTGRSLMPVMRGEVESVYGADDIRAIEVSGNSALYKGDYKITRSMPPAGDGQWRLFNMSYDPGETADLSAAEPTVMADMLNAYGAYAEEMGVLEMPSGYHSLEQILDNTTSRLIAQYRWYLIAISVVLLGLLYGVYRAIKAIFA